MAAQDHAHTSNGEENKTINEVEKGAAAQDHEHRSNRGESKALEGCKCKHSHGEAVTAAGHRWERTTFSPLREALAYLHSKLLHSTAVAAGHRWGRSTFSPLRESLASLQCK